MIMFKFQLKSSCGEVKEKLGIGINFLTTSIKPLSTSLLQMLHYNVKHRNVAYLQLSLTTLEPHMLSQPAYYTC